LALVCLLTTLALSLPADAQPSDPFEGLSEAALAELLDLITAGEEAEAAEEWEAAITIYRRMWHLVPLEEYRFREAHCLAELGDFDQALLVFEQLSRSERPDISEPAAQRAAEVQMQLASAPATLRLTTQPSGAAVTLDGEGVGLTTAPLDLSVEPGQHEVLITLDGYQELRRTVTLEPGEERSLDVALTALDLPPIQPRATPLAPWLFGAGTVAAAATGVLFGILSENAAEDERTYDFQADGASRLEADQLAEDAESYATAANISFATAGALGIATVVLVVLEVVEPEDDAVVSWRPSLTPNLAGVTLQGSF